MKCLKHIGIQGKDSVFNPGNTRQGTTTHQNSTIGLPVSKTEHSTNGTRSSLTTTNLTTTPGTTAAPIRTTTIPTTL